MVVKDKVSHTKEKEINILKHELVPEHRILSKEEKEKFLERFNITARQLPKILITDAVVQQIGAKEGDVLEIKRKSPTAGITLYYRYVI